MGDVNGFDDSIRYIEQSQPVRGLSPDQQAREDVSQPIESSRVWQREGQARTAAIVRFHEIGEVLFQSCCQSSRRRLRFRGIRWRRQQFTKELKGGAKQVTAADGESFAAGTAFGGSPCYGEFTLLAETLVRWGFGAGAEQNFETPAGVFDAAGEIDLIHVALGIQGGKG